METEARIAEIKERLRVFRNPPPPKRNRCTSSCGDSDYDSDRHTHSEECCFHLPAHAKYKFIANAPEDIDFLLSALASAQKETYLLNAELAGTQCRQCKGGNFKGGRCVECDERDAYCETVVASARGNQSVEAALAELREMFPTEQTVEARSDSNARYFAGLPLGQQTHSYSYGLVTVGDEQFRGASLAEAMQRVREWKTASPSDEQMNIDRSNAERSEQEATENALSDEVAGESGE